MQLKSGNCKNSRRLPPHAGSLPVCPEGIPAGGPVIPPQAQFPTLPQSLRRRHRRMQGRADDFHPCQAILLVGNVRVKGFQLVDDLRAGSVGLKAVQVVADESRIEAKRLDLQEEFQVSRSLPGVQAEDQKFLPEYVFRRDIGLPRKTVYAFEN